MKNLSLIKAIKAEVSLYIYHRMYIDELSNLLTDWNETLAAVCCSAYFRCKGAIDLTRNVMIHSVVIHSVSGLMYLTMGILLQFFHDGLDDAVKDGSLWRTVTTAATAYFGGVILYILSATLYYKVCSHL